MSHITDLHIQQFRGLRNLHLSNLGQINLLVGANNSGKTSVLEAIATYCRPLDPWEWLNAARSREIKSSRISILESFTWLFPQAASNSANGLYQGQIVMTGNGDVPVREVVATLHEILVESIQENENSYDDERFDESSVIVRGADVTVHAKMNMMQPSLFSNNGAMTETLTFQLREDERFVHDKKAVYQCWQ
ncbi:MAG: AAA family ATPase [Chloroflexaceae bacterium]|nr:AAA family ATPase [Chloroflexaceae bacterium]